MKTVSTAVGLLGFVGIVASCMGGGSTGTPAAGPVDMRPRTTPEEASQKIARAQCEHEQRCQNVGQTSTFSSIEHCNQVKLARLSDEFAGDVDCKNGMSNEDVQECLSEVQNRGCGGISGVVADVQDIMFMECGSNQLCLD